MYQLLVGCSVAEINYNHFPQATLKTTKLKINMQAYSKLNSVFRNSGTKHSRAYDY